MRNNLKCTSRTNRRRTIVIGVTREVFAANAGGGLNEFAGLFGTEI